MRHVACAIAQRGAAILLWVAVWLVAAACVDNSLLVAGPVDTLAALACELVDPAFWVTVATSGARIVASALLAAVVGVVAGFASARFVLVACVLDPAVQVMKSAPVACVSVILLVVLGSSGAVVVVVSFVALPSFYAAAIEAASAKRRDTARVLTLAGLGRVGVFLTCTWPACLPFFQAAAKTAVGMAWRAGVTAELLGVPLGSIGAAVYVSKLTLDVAGLLAWTLVVMVCALVCEKAVSALLAATRKTPRLAISLAARARKARLRGAASGSDVAACGVRKAFGEQHVLEGVSLRVSAGERVCLMAPTGAGKSTLLRIVLGFERPDSGEVACPELCGVVMQGACLVEELTAYENVALVAAPSWNEPALRDRLAKLLPEGCVDKPARELSGGTRRLVEIARALMSPGEAVVLDEPFAGLDDATRQRACAFVAGNLNGRALLAATHNSHDAELLQAQVLTLEELRQSAVGA